MFTLVGLVMVLATASYGTAFSCNATDKTEIKCYGAVGQSVFIHLVTNPTGLELRLKNKITNVIVFTYKNKTSKQDPGSRLYGTFVNGTFHLTKAEKIHSGEYLLEIHYENGTLLQEKTINLTIKVPVSTPTLSQLCLPHGETRVSCSAEGDDPQYNWTLGNRLLDEGMAYLNNENHTVILKKNMSGALTCTVHNLISSTNITQELITCPGLGTPVNCVLPNKTEIQVRMNASLDAIHLLNNTEIFFNLGGTELSSAICYILPYSPQGGRNDTIEKCPPCGNSMLIPVAGGAVALLLILLLSMCCLYKRKNNPTSPDNTTEDGQELVYAQVTVTNKKNQRRREVEPDVVYGQVKV